ncbi:TIM-barrel domain-containing protein [Mammaliicoccus stepanovicii]|uniref:Antiadhesin Pls n=1 Tax=Mammaliicoccus stepanovicii TaxID=643214 RepID=A0A239ZGM5_9STAP|nr:TIM-barrel domain-containing protein [Mammaliicoccus stepanovicii]PNZ79039.1 hypothetical protein CD111_01490 [Mammaliicoccus stepanovicii]GGI41842.1 hypothetical protein GCM10010896_15440 [Mammaliicoccus stepanovicii]SNV70229.1 antiadhesin Pls [Mammaliicoccus stepanovicii]
MRKIGLENERQFQKFTIKKVKLGVGSFLIGTALVFGVGHDAFADENANQTNTEQTSEEAGIKSIDKKDKYYQVEYNNGTKARVYNLSDKLFRYYLDPSNKFSEPEQSAKDLNAKILDKPLDEYSTKAFKESKVTSTKDGWRIKTKDIHINFNKKNGTFNVTKPTNNGEETILEETKPITTTKGKSTQYLADDQTSHFYGGGTQNGKVTLNNETIKIENTNKWDDGDVTSPNPFYWSDKGYGVVRNTFKKGTYDFNKQSPGTVATSHDENRFDAFYFFDDKPNELIKDYHELTGEPALTPMYGFYEAHLNAYNRDYWVKSSKDEKGAIKMSDGKYYKEYLPEDLPKDRKGTLESLNGEKDNYIFSARNVIDEYEKHDMPLGWFLPNDGYGAGYGQEKTLDGNIKNLKEFADYANKKGIKTGLWTQENLKPKDPNNPKKNERDFAKEVDAGVTALKTDVAWVGEGYSFGLDGIDKAVKMLQEEKGDSIRPFIISLDGWAGTQRNAAIWSGDQSGGEWEYIRFHIPTYIGQGMSGNPNAASDMDGIFKGSNPVINTRDYQWKAFTPIQLNMDGWGTNPKNPYAFDKKTTDINRAYLKQKSMLMPYIYSTAAASTFDGKPMIRALSMEEADVPESYSENAKYEYMWGDNMLVAPIYQDTKSDKAGNDVRNGIYLPNKEEIWVDYYTGKEYKGGQVLNNFDAPIWKLPVFVKKGSILPITNPNNNPTEIDNTHRKFEIFPGKNSEFKIYEDDGLSDKYKKGEKASSNISTKENKNKLSVKIDKMKGAYDGMVKKRDTELNIKTESTPKSVTVKSKGKPQKLKAVDSLEEFKKGTNVYYVDNKYTTNSYLSKIGKDMGQSFLRVKTDQHDITKEKVEVEIKGLNK